MADEHSQFERLKYYADQLFTHITNKPYFKSTTNIHIYDVANETPCTNDLDNKIKLNNYVHAKTQGADNNNIKIFVMNAACASALDMLINGAQFPIVNVLPPGISHNDNIHWIITKSGKEYDDTFIVYIGYLFRFLLSKHHVLIYTKDDYSRPQHDKENVYTVTLLEYGLTTRNNIISFNEFATFPSYVSSVGENPIPISYTQLWDFKIQINNVKEKMKTNQQPPLPPGPYPGSSTSAASSSSDKMVPIVKLSKPMDMNLLRQRLADERAKAEKKEDEDNHETKKRKTLEQKYLKYKNKYLELKNKM